MEIKINKEISDYHESLFFGLSMRQFGCSVAALAAAVGTYFGLRGVFGKETVSWLCIVCAVPIAAAGFFRYNGMNLEEFLIAWYNCEFRYAGVRKWESENILESMVKEAENDVLLEARSERKKKRSAKRRAVDPD